MSYSELVIRPVAALDGLGKRIKKLREDNNKTVKEVALNVGVSESTYYNWERGVKVPTIDSLINLAEIYSVSFDELLDRKGIAGLTTKIEMNHAIAEEIKRITTTLEAVSKSMWTNYRFWDDDKVYLNGKYLSDVAIYTFKDGFIIDSEVYE